MLCERAWLKIGPGFAQLDQLVTGIPSIKFFLKMLESKLQTCLALSNKGEISNFLMFQFVFA